MADAKSQYNELVSIWDDPAKFNAWSDKYAKSQGYVLQGGGYDMFTGEWGEPYWAKQVGSYVVPTDDGSFVEVPQYAPVNIKSDLMQQINTLAPQVGQPKFVSENANSTVNRIASELAAQRDKYGTEHLWQGGARAGFGGVTGLDVQMAGDLASRGVTSLSQVKQKEIDVPEQTDDYGNVVAPASKQKVAWNTATDQPLARQGYQHQYAGTGNIWSGTYAGPGNTTYNVDFAANGEPIFYTGGRSSSDFSFGDLAPILAIAAIAAGQGYLAPELLGAGEVAAAGLTGEAGALAANAGLAGGAAGAGAAGLGELAAAYGAEQIGGITAADLASAGLSAGLDEATMADILKTIPEPAMTQPVPAQPEIVSTPISDTGELVNLPDEQLLQNVGYDAVESASSEGVLPTDTATAEAAANEDITALMDSGAGGGPNVQPGDYFSANTPITAADAAANEATRAGVTATAAGLPALKDLIPLAPALTRLLSDSGGGGGGIGGAGGWSGTMPRYEMVQTRLPLDDTGRRPGSAGRRYFSSVEYRPIMDTSAVGQQTTTSSVTPNKPNASGIYNPTEAIPTESQTGVSTGGFAGGGLAGLAQGRYLGGPTDGMADQIPANIEGKQPAALSHGEFVIPADVVSHLGNGNSDAGAQRLYSMMDKIRKARTGTTKQGKQINPDKYLPV